MKKSSGPLAHSAENEMRNAPSPFYNNQAELDLLGKPWTFADEFVRGAFPGAQYHRYVGGTTTDQLYQMLIRQMGHQFEPILGTERGPLQDSAVAAAEWLMLRYESYPDDMRLNLQAYHRKHAVPGGRWSARHGERDGLIVLRVVGEQVLVQPYKAYEPAVLSAGLSRESYMLPMQELVKGYRPRPLPPVVRGLGQPQPPRQLLYGRLPSRPDRWFVVVYGLGASSTTPVFKRPEMTLEEVESAFGQAVRDAISGDEGYQMPEMPYKHYRELQFVGQFIDEMADLPYIHRP